MIAVDLLKPGDGLFGLIPFFIPHKGAAQGKQQLRILRLQAQRLVWPASLDGDAAAIAAMTERLMLTEQLAKLELGEQGTPSLETPLLEMTDPQVIELGVSMGMGKLCGLAWSCAGGGPQACGGCVGCRRRRQALEAGGIIEGEAPGKRGRRAG